MNSLISHLVSLAFRLGSVAVCVTSVIVFADQPTVQPIEKNPALLSREQFDQDISLVAIPGRNFLMMKYDVTFELWDACVADGGCLGYRPSDENQGHARQPVININYEEAESFAAWLSQRTARKFRLPRSEEWEYAARGGSTTEFWWGSTVDCSKANFARLSGGVCEKNMGSRKVGIVVVDALAPNPFGLYNITGNVWQWTSTCAQPSGSAECQRRVLRGGSWIDLPRFVSPAFTGNNLAIVHAPVYGFRLVVDK